MSVAQDYAPPAETGTPTRSGWQQPRAVIVTRSETVECSCPDHCERDHEQD